MKPEDAIYQAMRDTCDALATKFRSCARDKKFLDEGAGHFKTARDALRAAFLQAAHDTETFRDNAKIAVTTKDPTPASPARETCPRCHKCGHRLTCRETKRWSGCCNERWREESGHLSDLPCADHDTPAPTGPECPDCEARHPRILIFGKREAWHRLPGGNLIKCAIPTDAARGHEGKEGV